MKILIIRVSSMGDVVHNMPIVADILRHHPQAQIDWVVEEGYVELVKLNQQVRRIIPFALRRWRKKLFTSETRAQIRTFISALRAESYDVVLDTQGLLKTGVVMGLARITNNGCKAGLANGTEGSGYEGISKIFHTLSVKVGPRTHAVLRGRLVAAAALNYEVDGPADFSLSPPALTPAWLPSTPYAVFFHGTARDSKKWSRQNWAALAPLLTQRHLPLLLPWSSEDEKEEAQQIAANFPNAHLLPKLSMLEAVTLAQRAELVIGVDTGLTHIAAAFNRPTIELYCDSPRWKTQGDWADCIINLGDHQDPPSVEAVKNAVENLMPCPA